MNNNDENFTILFDEVPKEENEQIISIKGFIVVLVISLLGKSVLPMIFFAFFVFVIKFSFFSFGKERFSKRKEKRVSKREKS